MKVLFPLVTVSLQVDPRDQSPQRIALVYAIVGVLIGMLIVVTLAYRNQSRTIAQLRGENIVLSARFIEAATQRDSLRAEINQGRDSSQNRRTVRGY